MFDAGVSLIRVVLSDPKFRSSDYRRVVGVQVGAPWSRAVSDSIFFREVARCRNEAGGRRQPVGWQA
jgi:hypothetical protein